MRTTYAGVIGCNLADDFFETLSNNRLEKYQWKKMFESDSHIDVDFTRTEVVENVEAIADDTDITVVFLSEKYLHLAPQLIKAGKSIRTV